MVVSRRFSALLLALLAALAIALPRTLQLGRDMAGQDAVHLKNWSYVFMQEFEAGRYDQLYVTPQPAVLTIYSNIIGFKGLYFLRDKLHLISVEGKELELLLHTFQKVPKVAAITLLSVVGFFLVRKLYGGRVGWVFLVLLALEPYLIGQDRVIQTDALPAYLLFLAALLLVFLRRRRGGPVYLAGVVGILLGLAILEKASSFVFLPVAGFLLFLHPHRWRNLGVLTAATFLTLFALFPAFWGDFGGTLHRLTVGSFQFGVEGLNTETFTYKPINPGASFLHYPHYPRFFYNTLSEIVWVGLVILAVRAKWLGFFKNPVVLFPVVHWLLHEIAVRKADRYLTTLIPFLVLGAALGYASFLKGRKPIYAGLFLVGIVGLRWLQFRPLFPDLLLYQNPLSLDRSFVSQELGWGSGGYKAGRFLVEKFGSSREVLMSDYPSFALFYPGRTANFDDYQCSDPVDLVMTTSPLNRPPCLVGQVALVGHLEIPGGVEFFVYE